MNNLIINIINIMNTTVYDLWKSILTYGENTRVKNLDGLKSWNRMKDILNQNIIMV